MLGEITQLHGIDLRVAPGIGDGHAATNQLHQEETHAVF
jgi:hypothetical protein